MKKFYCVIPVRNGSSRLKNKASCEIWNGNTAVDLIYKRLSLSKYLDKIIFTSTKKSENKIIEKNVKKYKCDFVYGDEEDLSLRVMESIISVTNANTENIVIVYITGDCPLIDPCEIDYLIDKFLINDNCLQYVSNVLTRSYPDGFDVQIFDYELLETARQFAIKNDRVPMVGFDIVHFSGYFQQSLIDLKISNYPANKKNYHPDWLLTLDYQEDIEVIRKIYEHFGNHYFTTDQVIEFLEKNQDILLSNYNLNRKIPGM